MWKYNHRVNKCQLDCGDDLFYVVDTNSLESLSSEKFVCPSSLHQCFDEVETNREKQKI